MKFEKNRDESDKVKTPRDKEDKKPKVFRMSNKVTLIWQMSSKNVFVDAYCGSMSNSQ